MKAHIEGISVECTPKELAEFLEIRKQQSNDSTEMRVSTAESSITKNPDQIMTRVSK